MPRTIRTHWRSARKVINVRVSDCMTAKKTFDGFERDRGTFTDSIMDTFRVFNRNDLIS